MKGIRQRAEEVARFCWSGECAGMTDEAAVERVAKSFRECARDQRHNCAEVALDAVPAGITGYYDCTTRVHAAVMNARAPGE